MKRKKRSKKNVLLTRILLILTYLTAGWFLLYIDRPVDPVLPVKKVRILPGTGFFEVVNKLQKEGLVRNTPFFYVLILTKGAARHLRSGEYTFSGKMTPLAIVNKLSRGETDVCRITVPEDMNLRELAAHLAKLHLVDEKKFLSLATDRTFLRSLGIEEGSAEGYLYPDTYFFDFAISPEQLMRRMVEQFWRVVTPEMRTKVHQMGMTMNEFVTMASLIGKETGDSTEKPLIAAVFHNRLKKGMRLHLLIPTPHNTYFIKGLPPGPIANPGRDSLAASLNPAEVEYLYFVSKGNGSHQFSSTLKEHNEAVVRYRLVKEKGV